MVKKMENNNLKKPVHSAISFIPDADKPWIIKISQEGIKFNREDYPNVAPDEFARAFCEILERCYDVSFTRKD